MFRGEYMEIVLMIISTLLILIILLQSGKAEAASNVISGGNDSLFQNRKERGGELFVTRLTFFLGMTFFILCLIIGF